MILNFANGIEIVIDDEKLLSWQQSNDNRFVMLTIKEGSGYRQFTFDTLERKFYDEKRLCVDKDMIEEYTGNCSGCTNNDTEECLHCCRAYSDCYQIKH